MYNFNFLRDEKLIQVFDDIWIKVNEQEKITTIALTNKRLLFLDYDNNDYRENLRISGKINYVRYKEVYYFIELENIKNIVKSETYRIDLSNSKTIDFNNEDLFKLIEKIINKK